MKHSAAHLKFHCPLCSHGFQTPHIFKTVVLLLFAPHMLMILLLASVSCTQEMWGPWSTVLSGIQNPICDSQHAYIESSMVAKENQDWFRNIYIFHFQFQVLYYNRVVSTVGKYFTLHSTMVSLVLQLALWALTNVWWQNIGKNMGALRQSLANDFALN